MLNLKNKCLFIRYVSYTRPLKIIRNAPIKIKLEGVKNNPIVFFSDHEHTIYTDSSVTYIGNDADMKDAVRVFKNESYPYYRIEYVPYATDWLIQFDVETYGIGLLSTQ